jgi:hypothetical protein
MPQELVRVKHQWVINLRICLFWRLASRFVCHHIQMGGDRHEQVALFVLSKGHWSDLAIGSSRQLTPFRGVETSGVLGKAQQQKQRRTALATQAADGTAEDVFDLGLIAIGWAEPPSDRQETGKIGQRLAAIARATRASLFDLLVERLMAQIG